MYLPMPEVWKMKKSPRDKHVHAPEEERRIREAALDETIAESFLASDPPSSLPNPDDHDALERARVDKNKRSR